MRGFHHAPKRTRTSTGESPHKALNLARLPTDFPFSRLTLPRQGARPMDLDLTKRQQEIFDFIKHYSTKYGYPPTVRDIGKAVGLASSSTVHAYLANLEKSGLLRRDPSKPRAIELLDRAIENVRDAVDSGVRSVVGRGGIPVLGQVAAGAPVLAEENIEDYVEVPQ